MSTSFCNPVPNGFCAPYNTCPSYNLQAHESSQPNFVQSPNLTKAVRGINSHIFYQKFPNENSNTTTQIPYSTNCEEHQFGVPLEFQSNKCETANLNGNQSHLLSNPGIGPQNEFVPALFNDPPRISPVVQRHFTSAPFS